MNKKLILLIGLGVATLQTVHALDIKQLQKSWTGRYDDQKIGVFIQSIDANKVTGYSILGKNKQSFSGKVQATSQGYKIVAAESGPKATSGTFTFVVSHAKPNLLDASWESQSGTVKPKYFDLKAQQCRYAKNAGEYSEASERLLKDDDLQMRPETLDVMRNTIYARHGYSFSNKDWANYFADEAWYMPCSIAVESKLTPIEKANIQRINKVRPYMSKMEWGR